MKRYIHIGYAKSGSTWLQNSFFSQHEQLYHLGKFKGSQVVDDNIQRAFRSGLIEESEFSYDYETTARHFQRHFDEAARSGKKACGISHELLTNSVNGRVDLAERARRIAKIFDYDAKIIMVVRNQFDFIKSLYSGLLVEGGIPLTFQEFLFYFYYDSDRSSMYNLYYDKVYELYVKLFGKENVHVLPYELLPRGKHLDFVNIICDFIGVDSLCEVNEDRANQSRSGKVLSLLLKENKDLRRCLGNHVFERPWGFAYTSVYRNLLKVDPPEQVLASHKNYQRAWRLSDRDVAEYEAEFGEIEPLNLIIPPDYRQMLGEKFAGVNQRLADLTGVDLSQFAYPGLDGC